MELWMERHALLTILLRFCVGLLFFMAFLLFFCVLRFEQHPIATTEPESVQSGPSDGLVEVYTKKRTRERRISPLALYSQKFNE